MPIMSNGGAMTSPDALVPMQEVGLFLGSRLAARVIILRATSQYGLNQQRDAVQSAKGKVGICEASEKLADTGHSDTFASLVGSARIRDRAAGTSWSARPGIGAEPSVGAVTAH